MAGFQVCSHLSVGAYEEGPPSPRCQCPVKRSHYLTMKNKQQTQNAQHIISMSHIFNCHQQCLTHGKCSAEVTITNSKDPVRRTRIPSLMGIKLFGTIHYAFLPQIGKFMPSCAGGRAWSVTQGFGLLALHAWLETTLHSWSFCLQE